MKTELETQPVDGMGMTEAMPPAGMQAQPPSNPFADRLKKSYPDREFANDDEINAGLTEYMDGLEVYQSSTKDLHSKLAEVLDAVPELAGIIRDVSKGATFSEALSRNVDIEDLTPVEGDPDYEAWTKNLETRKAGKQSMQENLDMSATEIRAFAEENGMTPQDATKFLDAVDALIGEVVSGKLTRKTLAQMKKGLDYEIDVQAAEQAGEVRGRNTKIEAKRESQQSTGDGMPAITSSAALPEPKPKPKADPWSQAIDQEVTKRKKLV